MMETRRVMDFHQPGSKMGDWGLQQGGCTPGTPKIRPARDRPAPPVAPGGLRKGNHQGGEEVLRIVFLADRPHHPSWSTAVAADGALPEPEIPPGPSLPAVVLLAQSRSLPGMADPPMARMCLDSFPLHDPRLPGTPCEDSSERRGRQPSWRPARIRRRAATGARSATTRPMITATPPVRLAGKPPVGRGGQVGGVEVLAEGVPEREGGLGHDAHCEGGGVLGDAAVGQGGRRGR